MTPIPLDDQLNVPASNDRTISHQDRSVTTFDLLCPDSTLVPSDYRFAQELYEEGVPERGGYAENELLLIFN